MMMFDYVNYLLNLLSPPQCPSFPLYSMLYIPSLNYILYGQTMKSVQQLLLLLVSLFPSLLLLLIVIYDGVGTNDEMIIMDWGLVC